MPSFLEGFAEGFLKEDAVIRERNQKLTDFRDMERTRNVEKVNAEKDLMEYRESRELEKYKILQEAKAKRQSQDTLKVFSGNDKGAGQGKVDVPGQDPVTKLNSLYDDLSEAKRIGSKHAADEITNEIKKQENIVKYGKQDRKESREGLTAPSGENPLKDITKKYEDAISKNEVTSGMAYEIIGEHEFIDFNSDRPEKMAKASEYMENLVAIHPIAKEIAMLASDENGMVNASTEEIASEAKKFVQTRSILSKDTSLPNDVEKAKATRAELERNYPELSSRIFSEEGGDDVGDSTTSAPVELSREGEQSADPYEGRKAKLQDGTIVERKNGQWLPVN